MQDGKGLAWIIFFGGGEGRGGISHELIPV